jgi:FkbM family methyltransferase
MKYVAAGFVQRAIRRLPRRRSEAVKLWGGLTRGKTPAIVNAAHMTLDLEEGIQRSMFLGTYEPEQTSWFRQCLRVGDTVVDVGASFGYYTTLSSQLVGPEGRVFAFEPSPVASQVIANAVAESRINNITLTRAALGREAKTVSLYLANTPYLHSPSILPIDAEFAPVDVPVMRLDAFPPLANKGMIRLLKMDVEGYEPDVLDGMMGLIQAGLIENVVCEFNSFWLERNGCTPAALLERFLGFGFEVRAKTKLQKDLPGHKGARFDLQDFWFTKPSS